jgi:hypothetical protein
VQEVYTSVVQAPYKLVRQLLPVFCAPQAIPALQPVEAASRSALLERTALLAQLPAPHALLEHIVFKPQQYALHAPLEHTVV